MNYSRDIRTESPRTQYQAEARVPSGHQATRSSGKPANQAGIPNKPEGSATPRFAEVLANARNAQTSTPAGAPRSMGMTPALAETVTTQRTDVQFSIHATERLRMRGIQATPEMVRSLDTAMTQLSAKQARDSLVVIGDLGFVVNVPNRTVVTAISMSQGGSHLYTNIDSAMWMAPPIAGV
ncbi:MAG: hypothetical protein OWU32_03085 [Firmicutes bacterium]|nr:hypothetical protein [Bacillota bacterium]